jgi:hypothetical protein
MHSSKLPSSLCIPEESSKQYDPFSLHFTAVCPLEAWLVCLSILSSALFKRVHHGLSCFILFISFLSFLISLSSMIYLMAENDETSFRDTGCVGWPAVWWKYPSAKKSCGEEVQSGQYTT